MPESGHRSIVTAVLVGRGHYPQIEMTLQSLHAACPSGLASVIAVQDGPDVPADIVGSVAFREVEWISTHHPVGLIAAVDYAYSRVQTPYILHVEAGWRFLRAGFLEPSIVVLQSNPKCVQVHLRSADDLAGHPVEAHTYCDHGVRWRRLALDYSSPAGRWHGFSFDPGLRRLSDYVAIGGYGIHTKLNGVTPRACELVVGDLYRRRDFFGAVLADAGYVRRSDRRVGAVPGIVPR
jgi:hypothetical protein